MKKPEARWVVEFHDEFLPEFQQFSQDVQNELLECSIAVRTLGPDASRPHVGTLKNPPHPNMKEMRFKANNGREIWRAAFAFDTQSKAVVLVAAAKQGTGSEDKFYKDLLRVANKRLDSHEASLKQAAKVAAKPASTKETRERAESKRKR